MTSHSWVPVPVPHAGVAEEGDKLLQVGDGSILGTPTAHKAQGQEEKGSAKHFSCHGPAEMHHCPGQEKD